MRGKMLWFNEVKGHGYIATEEGERLYVDSDGFLPAKPPEGRCAGLPVAFEVAGTDGDRRAESVALVEDAAPRRARARRRS